MMKQIKLYHVCIYYSIDMTEVWNILQDGRGPVMGNPSEMQNVSLVHPLAPSVGVCV